MPEINLIPKVSEAEVKKAFYRRRVNLTAMISLLFVGAVIFALLGFRIYLLASASRIVAQTKQVEEKISSEYRKEITRRALVDKLDFTNQFLNSIAPYSIAWQELIKMLGSSQQVLNESQVRENQTITFTSSAANSDSVISLIDQLTNENIKGMFGNVNLVKLDKTSGKPYNMTIDLKFLIKGLPEATSSAKLIE